MQIPPPEILIPIIIVIFFAIGLHEYAHCKMADAAGDPTPGVHGRVTLDLTKHFEVTGTIMMIVSSISGGYGLGWGKAAPMDPRKMRNPRWDLFAAVAAGPLSNVLQAAFYGMWLRLILATSPDALNNKFLFFLLVYGVTMNLSLCFFNLIPLGPLDGHWLVGQLLPEKQRYYWYRFNREIGRTGLFILMIVLAIIANNGGPNVLQMVVGPPIEFMFKFLTGRTLDQLYLLLGSFR